MRDLQRANIKLWMLTGDKMEVAEQVARASRLIQPDFDVRRHFDQRFDQLDFNFQ